LDHCSARAIREVPLKEALVMLKMHPQAITLLIFDAKHFGTKEANVSPTSLNIINWKTNDVLNIPFQQKVWLSYMCI